MHQKEKKKGAALASGLQTLENIVTSDQTKNEDGLLSNDNTSHRQGTDHSSFPGHTVSRRRRRDQDDGFNAILSLNPESCLAADHLVRLLLRNERVRPRAMKK